MKYKIGDAVKIYTWSEMLKLYPENACSDKNSVSIRNGWWHWCKEEDNRLPENRIVEIKGIDDDEDYLYKYENGMYSIFDEMIKGYANEYYLQEIKEELCFT